MGPADLSAEGSGKVARQIEGTAVQRRALGFLALAELLGMTLWFSATAVVPTLEEEWDLSTASTAWLTMSVQIGFVAGTFLSAFFVFVVETGEASNRTFNVFDGALPGHFNQWTPTCSAISQRAPRCSLALRGLESGGPI